MQEPDVLFTILNSLYKHSNALHGSLTVLICLCFFIFGLRRLRGIERNKTAVELNKMPKQDDGAKALQGILNQPKLQGTAKLTTRALDKNMKRLLTDVRSQVYIYKDPVDEDFQF